MTFMLTWLRAVGLFYRSVAPFTVGISALLVGAGLLPALFDDVAGGALPLLMLLKLATVPVVWYLAEQARPHQYWFYFNLGISRRRLWAGVVLLDTLLFVGLAEAVRVGFMAFK